MTLAERLKALSGISGATVGQMLAGIAAGSSMGEIIVAYSGLAVATVEQHLQVSRVDNPVTGGSRRRIRLPHWDPAPIIPIRPCPARDDVEVLLLIGAL